MLDRNDIYGALCERLFAIEGLETYGKRFRDWLSMQPSEMPALFVLPADGAAQHERGRPARWTLRYDVFVYVHDASDEGPIPKLHDLILAVDNAITPQPDEARHADARFQRGASALGGLASYCLITNVSMDVAAEQAGGFADRAVAVVTLEVGTVG